MKLTTYKDFEIGVSEQGLFRADGIENSYETLEELRAKIDAETKIKFKPQKVLEFVSPGYRNNGPRSIREITATRPHGHPDRREFWTVDENKQRCTKSRLIKDTPDNRQLMTIIIAKRNEADAIIKEAEALDSKLDRTIVLEQV